MIGKPSEILFEKFEIVEVLKKDEHAAVYLANHIYLSKRMILKILNTQRSPDQALVERFKREAKLLAKLDHPNIIKVMDFGTSKEYFYISFEYIEGTSMRIVLNSQTLSFDEKNHLMVQLLKALHYAHSFQIIHRDIKPENIFVDKSLNLKLGDFGLALSSEDSSVTNPYSIVGTPSYMSPEQVRGAKLTLQSDLFSAGVVIYELFTGKNPFLKENVTLTLNEIMSYNEDTIKGNIEELPQNLKEVLYRLLKKKPEHRYGDALDVLNDLNISTEQQTIVITRTEQKIKFEKIKIISAFAAVFVILIVIIGIQVFNQDKQNTFSSNPPKNETTNPAAGKESQQNGKETLIDSDKTNIDNLEKPLVENEKQNITNAQQGNNQNDNIYYGALLVNCFPFADVYVDGEKIGTTPIQRPITFSAKSHTLKLVHPDYPAYSKQIQIRNGETTKINVLLDTTMSYIKCNVSPWGDVYVNGDKKGTTPIGLIKVVPGFVNLTIKHPDFKDIDTAFRTKQNDTLKLKFRFKK
jgi:eukaryotic-like serine/threonine-protein kinase